MLPLALLVIGPKIDIVGKWNSVPQPYAIEFLRNGTLRLKGFNVTAVGTYKVKGDTVTITLTKRNGSAPGPQERTGTGKIIAGGKAILFSAGGHAPTAARTIRLVRAK